LIDAAGSLFAFGKVPAAIIRIELAEEDEVFAIGNILMAMPISFDYGSGLDFIFPSSAFP